MGRGYAWLDTGTHASLQQASSYIETLESRQGLRVACPEEIAYRQGWISRDQLLALAEPLCQSGYGDYLRNIAHTIWPSCKSSTPLCKACESYFRCCLSFI